MKFKNLVFDLGGVFLDIDKKTAVPVFKSLGLERIDYYLDEYRQKGFFLELERGTLDAAGFCREMSRECGRPISHEDCLKAWLSFIIGMKLDKWRFVNELRSSYKIYLLSNTNPFVMEWARSKAFTPWGQCLDDFFDGLYLSCELKCLKPDREIFDALTADTGIIPAETLFIDDGPANTAAGRMLGFHTFEPLNGEDWREALSERLRGGTGEAGEQR